MMDEVIAAEAEDDGECSIDGPKKTRVDKNVSITCRRLEWGEHDVVASEGDSCWW